MKKAVLIGFEYLGDKKLPGITIDLYLVYNLLKKMGWEDEQIKVLTDIEKDHPTKILKTAIKDKIVNSDVLSFIEMISVWMARFITGAYH